MKMLIALLFVWSAAYAGEVPTECPAMNNNREKIVKDVSAKKVRTRSQVVSQ